MVFYYKLNVGLNERKFEEFDLNMDTLLTIAFKSV